MLELSSYIYELQYGAGNRSQLGCYNGLRHGIELIYKSDGSNYWLRYWRNGIPHGITINYWKDLILNLTQWHNGLKHGIEIQYYIIGMTYRLFHWRHGKSHGVEIKYRVNGSIEWLQHWRNGKRN